MTLQEEYIQNLIRELQRIWPVEQDIELVVADDEHEVWTLAYSETAEAACNMNLDKITIYVRDKIEPSYYWQSVVCHEYAHAVTAKVFDYLRVENLSELSLHDYHHHPVMREIERTVKYIGGLLNFALQNGAVCHKDSD